MPKPMSQMQAAGRLKIMKPGDKFSVETNKDRITLLKVAKTLRAAGYMSFQIITKEQEKGGYLIVAV